MADENEILQHDDGAPLPPLADPVIAEIFKSVDLAGLAMCEIINAVLQDSNDELISDVIDLTPQHMAPSAKDRGYRIDVLAKTASNEIIVFEVQLSTLLITNERSLLYAEQALGNNAKKGDTWNELAKGMPRILVITLLNFDLRKTGENFHQVAELTYRELPRELASTRFGIHDIQLPRFRKIEPDFTKPLHCWLTAICRSQDNKRSLKEVVEMDAHLSSYADRNPGMKQFIDRHEIVSADKDTRHNYQMWMHEQTLMGYEKMLLRKEGVEEGLEKGRVEERKKTALNMINKNYTDDNIMEITKLSYNEIQVLRSSAYRQS